MKKSKLWRRLAILLILAHLCVILMMGGANLNSVAMNENNGKMPVKLDFYVNYEEQEHFYFVEKEEVNKYFLADITKIGNHLYSLGDFIIYLGFALYLALAVLIIIQSYKIIRLNKNSKKETIKKIKILK